MKRLTCLVFVFLIWLLLTWSLDYQQLAAGLILSVLVTFFVADTFPSRPGRLLNPVRWFWLLLYLPYFLYYVVKANLDVAYRVLHPDIPIHPGIVKVKTTLTTEMGKAFLANSITLTPGTLVVDIVDQDLYVHWINVTTQDPAEQTKLIVENFEPMLRKIFE